MSEAEAGTSGGSGHVVTNVGNRRPVVMPEMFSGSKEDDWEAWLTNFETCAILNKWEGVTKAQFLSVRLKGAAQGSLQELSTEVKNSYDQLKEALTAKFAPSQKLELHKAEFRTRRKEKGEGLREFADNLTRLARRAYPDLPSGPRDELAKDRFIDGLDDREIRIKLREVMPKTLNDALCRAIQVEAIEAAEGQSQPSRPVRAVTAGASWGAGQKDPILELLTRNQATLETIARSLDQTKRQQTQYHKTMQHPSVRPAPRRITCYNCGGKGHKAMECRAAPSSSSQKPFGPKSGNRA